MRLLVAHLYAKLWARRHGCRYARIRRTTKGIMELPSGQRFSFDLAFPRPFPSLGLPMLNRVLAYNYRQAKALPR